MIEFLVDNDSRARLVRTMGDFEIVTDGQESLRLRRDVGKKIWFALLVQLSALKTFHRDPRRRLYLGERKKTSLNSPHADFVAGSNCHGTAYQIMNPNISPLGLRLKWSAIFSKILGPARQMLEMEAYLSKKENDFPVCIVDYGISHSAIIVGYDPVRCKYLIFEKGGYHFIFRLLFLDTKEMIDEGYTGFLTKMETMIHVD